MNVEDRLRAAMHAASDHVEPDEVAGLAAVRTHGRAARRRRRVLVAGFSGVLVVVAASVAVTRLDGDRGTLVISGQPSSTATTAPATTAPAIVSPTTVASTTSLPPTEVTSPTPTTTTTTTTTTPVAVFDQVIWPGPGHAAFDDPVAAARSFTEEFIGLGAPPLGAFRAVGPDVGAVDVHGVDESGVARDDIVSTITVQRFDGHWFVTAAIAEDVQIESPAPHAEVASPVRVEGRGRGYEGTIVVEVRDAFSPAGQFLGRRIAGGGCCEDLLPFNAVVAVSAPAGPTGAVVAYNDSGIVAVDNFTVLPVRFASTPNDSTGDSGAVTTLRVFFSTYVDGAAGDLVSVERTVPETTGVLRASLVAMLDGPTPEEQAAGLLTWLPPDSGGAVEGVDLDAGRVTVQLSSRLAELAAPPAGDQLIAELNATVFQFANVDVVRYELGDSCEAFDAWLGLGCEFVR